MGDATYVTVEAPETSRLVDVRAVTNPDPKVALPDLAFPIGFVLYEIHDVPIGERVDVRWYLENDLRVTDFYKYGPESEGSAPAFYSFDRDGQTNTGLWRSRRGRLDLRFVDGQRGDHDLSANGIIVDPGGPVLTFGTSWQNAFNPRDVNDDGFVSPLDALHIINFLNDHGAIFLPDLAPADSPDVLVDANADGSASPVDVLHVVNYLNGPPADEEAEGEGSGATPVWLLVAGYGLDEERRSGSIDDSRPRFSVDGHLAARSVAAITDIAPTDAALENWTDGTGLLEADLCEGTLGAGLCGQRPEDERAVQDVIFAQW
jgi:hypothetical protein